MIGLRRKSRSKQVCVVGCGKLGLPLVAVLADAGHDVVGFDLNHQLIASLSKNSVPWYEESLHDLLVENQSRVQFTSNLAETIDDSEFFLVIVPSPSDDTGIFVSKYVEDAISSIVGLKGETSQGDSYIVIVSTLMPGSSDEIWNRVSARFPDSVNRFKLIYSPEFIALGSVVRDMKNPDLVLIGAHDSQAADAYQELVSSYIETKPTYARLLPKEAEIAKIAVNSFVTTKISFANFISELCESSGGASASVVLASIGADSRIGRSYLKPGAPFGGPCFPRDNVAISKFSSSLGIEASIADSTHAVNRRQVARIARFIKNFGEHKRVLLVGVAYKPGTAVTDESPALSLSKELVDDYLVDLHDDYIADQETISSLGLIPRDEIPSEPICVVFMVPDPRYVSLPGLLHSDSVVIDLWGSFRSSVNQSSLTYYCLGEVLEKQ
jgi:UDPglucose 6-dehydrogenase